MRPVARWTLVAIVTALSWNPAAADDLQAPADANADDQLLDSSYRWLWTLPAVNVGPDAQSWKNFRSVLDIRRTSDGGHLILARELPFHLFNIKLDGSGQVELWTYHEWCRPYGSRDCSPKGDDRPLPWRMPDGSFWFQPFKPDELIRIASDGTEEGRIKIPEEIDMYDIDVLIAPDEAIYLADNAPGLSDVDIAMLLRLDPDGDERWTLKLPLRFGKVHVLEDQTELDLLANGDILWWIDGGPVMTTGPSRDFVMRVGSNGDIRPPGPLETSVPEGRKGWRIIGHHLLPDGRLLRYGEVLEGASKGFLRLEFWDGTGGTLLAQHVVDLDDAAHPLKLIDGGQVLAARGTHAFYMGGFWVEGGTLVIGFDANGTAAWRKFVPGGVISSDETSSIYVVTCDLPDPALYNCGVKIYMTEIE
ncbi:MAG: hypothetical protein WD044_16165 [Dongiaceae bacterium]